MSSTPPGTGTATATRPRPAVGVPHTRVEGPQKVTGQARFSAEIPFPELAHGWLVLSSVTRGRVTGVEDGPTLAMPGVLTVLHHGNAPRVEPRPGMLGPPDLTVALFQHDRVPSRGWPVALVVAETSEQAREAAETLVVRYEEEPHDTALHEEHPGAYVPEQGDPVARKGDLAAALAGSEVVVDELYSTPEQHHHPMEPHAATARWEDGRLELTDSNQGATWVAGDLATMFSLDPSAVRVRSEHVGGGFGSKGLRAHQVAAVMAATRLGRPVRVVLTRRQMFTLAGHRSPTVQRIRLGADPDGRLRALEHRGLNHTSHVYEFVEPSASVARILYDADAHHTDNRVVRLDVPSPTWMRAPGEAPGSFALECAMDELAERTGLDPIELRARNEPAVGPLSGLPFADRHLLDCFREGAARFGWDRRDPRPGTRREGRWLLGTGTAASSFPAGSAPSTAAITAEADGTFTVRIAAADIGTGGRTALTLVAADALEVPTDRVRVRIGDSDFGPAMIAGGSAGTRSWAWAVTAAARELREHLVPGTVPPPEGSTVRVDTTEAVKALPPKERYSYGAQFAEVAVDPGTGEIRVRRLLGVFAAGRIVNPLTARAQFVGGMTWGLSMALHEEAARDPHTGGTVGADLAGYHFAAHADVPPVETHWIERADPADPIGIKGIGEIGIVGTAAAVANAVWHATGVRHRALPIRPDRVLTAATRRDDAGPG
ncbi:xanthine dehydrogenase family protein molybdopterin-binding subunit [Streptomyces sp. NPDC091377]|uniref:xanthine dehydrogenase family protein molybdopterin-binding subunit n=1 Tax=Streptomyces sp. NPDC091377 TaxID=3365995 RepID=UPI00382AAE57